MSGMTKPFLAELEQEMASTKRVLERVPGDKLDWRPHVVAGPATLALLDRPLQRDPTARPADATAARGLLRRALEANGEKTTRAGPPESVPPLQQRVMTR